MAQRRERHTHNNARLHGIVNKDGDYQEVSTLISIVVYVFH